VRSGVVLLCSPDHSPNVRSREACRRRTLKEGEQKKTINACVRRTTMKKREELTTGGLFLCEKNWKKIEGERLREGTRSLGCSGMSAR